MQKEGKGREEERKRGREEGRKDGRTEGGRKEGGSKGAREARICFAQNNDNASHPRA